MDMNAGSKSSEWNCAADAKVELALDALRQKTK
jgi:hypothetical protein